jgi:DNA-directed RNA polymerase subunit RPC12/RpoP
VGDNTLNFEDYRRRRDEDADLVRCARCGKRILATVVRCPECGVHFQGEAQDYLHASERPDGGRSGWVVVLLIVLLAALIIGALTLG